MKFINILKSLILEASRYETLYDANVENPNKGDYYKMIGLKKGASQSTINSKIDAIRAKLDANPDKDNPKFDEVKRAIEILGDEQKRKKYDSNQSKKIPFELFKAMIFADPDTKIPRNFDIENATPENMNEVKVGAYTQWMLKNYQNPQLEMDDYDRENPKHYQSKVKEYQRLFIEDIDKIKIDLLKFHRFKDKLQVKDINKYNPLTLSIAVEDFKLSKDARSDKEEKMVKENPFNFPGSIIDFVGPNWTVVKIDNHKDAELYNKAKDAACYFGGYYDDRDEFDETNWCTSKVGGTYFDGYIKKGPLYVILPNESTQFGKKTGLPKERYQFHFDPQHPQYMDRRDRPVKLYDMLKEGGRLSELREYFKPEIAKNVATPQGNRVHLRIPEGPVGLFISLYGADKLLEQLDPDTQTLMVENNDKSTTIELKIPDSIGNLTNLKSVMFRNVLGEIPESICKCKSLKIIGAPDNPNMKKLPECIKDMPSLTFINLSGIPNGGKDKLPDGMPDLASGSDEGVYYRID